MPQSPLTQPDIRSQLIAKMLQEGTSYAPVQHWTQGAARLAQALYGGYQLGEQDQQSREAPTEILRMWKASQQPQQPAQHPLGPVTAGPRPATAAPLYAEPPVNMSDSKMAGGAEATAPAPLPPNPSSRAPQTFPQAVRSDTGAVGNVFSRGAGSLARSLMGGPAAPPPAVSAGLGAVKPPMAGGQEALASLNAPKPEGAQPPRGNMGAMRVYSQNEVNPMDVAGAGYGNATASIESGGRYNLQGPVTRTGDRAYGKHQVMGANIPSFTRDATGTAATPQQFLANPNLQENTFNNKFAEYINRYGSPEAAARAWFAGEGGMNNPNARDQLGTTVANYGQRFAQAAGVPQAGQAPPVMAQGGAPQVPQGTPQQQPSAGPPASQMAMIEQMINHPNPRVRAYGVQLMQTQMTQEPKYMVVGDKLVRIKNDNVTTVADADKPPAGYERAPGGALRAIPGGPATHVPSEAAGRIAMMDVASRDLPAARAALMKNRGEIGYSDVGNRVSSYFDIGEVGRAQRTVKLGVEAALRVMTGAAAPETEVKRYVDLFMPTQNDNPATAKQKMDNLENFMREARVNAMQGRTSGPPSGGAGAPQSGVRTYNPQTGRIE